MRVLGSVLVLSWGLRVEGAAVQYCGYQNLEIVMEQVPESWNAWQPNNDSMATFNEYMDLYRYVEDDGTWANNSENEFGGFPSSADLIDQWGSGFGWGGALALCVTSTQSGCPCCRIKQSDIFFNPAFTWTYDKTSAEYSSKVFYDSNCLHELGHSWGMQRPSSVEDYNYSLPTVMNSYVSWVVQDENQIHWPEAQSIRDLYSDQIDIIPLVRDMSVCSKFQTGGSWGPTTTDRGLYAEGDTFDVQNLMVENTGTTDETDVRVRIYLSTNRTISENDILCGTWNFATFDDENWWTGDLDGNVIPEDTCGPYYVGAMVTRDGDDYTRDDGWLFDNNDTTYLIDPILILCVEPIPLGSVLSFIQTGQGTSYFSAVIQHGITQQLIEQTATASTPAEFAQLLQQSWDLVVYAASPQTDSSPFETELVKYLRKGGRAIISDPRPGNAGAAAILEAAGTRFSGQINGTQMIGLNVLGTQTHQLNTGTGGVYSYGLDVTAASSAYARFGNNGDPAIVGITGRTVVAGFADDAMPVNAGTLSFFEQSLKILAAGRPQRQARVRYSLRPANWSMDGAGNVDNLSLLPNGPISVAPAGGPVQFAVLVEVEDTDSEGLFNAQFDLVASVPAVAVDPLNFGVRYRDPDSAKPTPDVRPIVHQSAMPVTIGNSVFAGGSDPGTPSPGQLTGVFLSQPAMGPQEVITRGVGQVGNMLSAGPTVIAVGTMHVPTGFGSLKLNIRPDGARVYSLAPMMPPPGPLPVFAAEETDGTILRIIRPRVFTPPAEAPQFGPGDCNNANVNVCGDGELCTHDLCDTGACLHQPFRYGDVNNDGFANVVDGLCLLDEFAGVSDSPACIDAVDGEGVSRAEKDLFPCPSEVGGATMGDGFVNSDDVLRVLDVFAGVTIDPACAACMGAPEAASDGAVGVGSAIDADGSATRLTLRTSAKQVKPGELFSVEAWLSGPVSSLRAYQVGLSSPGVDGAWSLETLSIDESHKGYVFGSDDGISAVSAERRALLNLLPAGETNVESEAYLGSFSIRAGRRARGVIEIGLKESETLLRDAGSGAMEVNLSEPLRLKVDNR